MGTGLARGSVACSSLCPSFSTASLKFSFSLDFADSLSLSLLSDISVLFNLSSLVFHSISPLSFLVPTRPLDKNNQKTHGSGRALSYVFPTVRCKKKINETMAEESCERKDVT